MENLSSQVLAQLYPKIYILREDSVLILSDEMAVKWKNKPQGKITFFIDKDEIKDKELTELLKNIVLALQIPTEFVSFAAIQGHFNAGVFKSMQTKIGLIFGDFFQGEAGTYGEKQIYIVPNLTEMTADENNKKIAWKTMKTFLNDLK